MRRVLVAFLAGAGIVMGLSIEPAPAAPLAAISALAPAQTLVEKVGYWRRYCRRHGCGPDVVVPDAGADVSVDVDVDGEAPAVVVLPPPRPLSCGEYRYWNGERCVDARYNNPYLGPK